MAWIFRTDLNNPNAGIVGMYDTTPHLPGRNTFLLYTGEQYIANLGVFGVSLPGGEWEGVVGTTPIPVGQWMHIVGTWRNSDGRVALYKNGMLEAAGSGGTGQQLQTVKVFTAKIGEWGVVRDWRYKFHGKTDHRHRHRPRRAAAECDAGVHGARA